MAAPMDVCLQLKQVLATTLYKTGHKTDRLVVCRRTKQFMIGEFHVPKGCITSKEEEVSSLLLSVLEKQFAAIVCDIRDEIIRESQAWLVKISDVRIGKYDCLEIFVDRQSLFAACIGAVCKEGLNYGRTGKASGQRVLLDLVCGSELLTCHNMTLDDLRALALVQHMKLLLESQGYQTSVTIASQHLATCEPLMKMLQMDSSTIVHSDLSEEIILSFMKRTSSYKYCSKMAKGNDAKFCEENDTISTASGTKHLSKSELTPVSSDVKKENESAQLICEEETAYEFDIKKFLEEKGYSRDKNNFDKNLHHAEVVTNGEPSDISRHVMMLEKSLQEKEASICLHIVPQNQVFQMQKVHTVLEGFSQKRDNFSQHHLTYGPVTHRKDDLEASSHTVDSYFRLRYKQMYEAAVMKYGSAVKGEGWENTINSVTSAGIKFELLSSVARTTVKLDFNEDDSSISDSRNGSFVMYNCARLATLFLHFQQSVEKGIYPPLPDVKHVDFSTLRDEAEWSLLFSYIYMFPDTVRQAVEEFKPTDSILSRLHTHKVCVFLSSLSRYLSSYYSRTHILGECRPHLLPTMYARLYLMKAVHQVMVNGLALLGITPLTQL